MKPFEHWQRLQQSENLGEFSTSRSGLLWLKIKSILRKDLIKDFIEFSHCRLSATRLNEQHKQLFTVLSENLESSHTLLDKFTRKVNRSQIESVDEQQLV